MLFQAYISIVSIEGYNLVIYYEKEFSKQFKPSALFIHWTVKIQPKKKRSSRIHIPRCS